MSTPTWVWEFIPKHCDRFPSVNWDAVDAWTWEPWLDAIHDHEIDRFLADSASVRMQQSGKPLAKADHLGEFLAQVGEIRGDHEQAKAPSPPQPARPVYVPYNPAAELAEHDSRRERWEQLPKSIRSSIEDHLIGEYLWAADFRRFWHHLFLVLCFEEMETRGIRS